MKDMKKKFEKLENGEIKMIINISNQDFEKI